MTFSFLSIFQLRKNVLCHLEGIFCGRPCGLDLPCGRHKCIKPCHLGKCLDEGRQEKCSQPCLQVRSGCGHPCNTPCHDGPCPNTPCNEKVPGCPAFSLPCRPELPCFEIFLKSSTLDVQNTAVRNPDLFKIWTNCHLDFSAKLDYLKKV